MENHRLCFCGSEKPHQDCHGRIHEKSFAADLFRLQAELDREIEKQKTDRNLTFRCGPGCGECCSTCFCVSETEFVQILDYMIHSFDRRKILEVIGRSGDQWRQLAEQHPDLAAKLGGAVALKDLFALNSVKLPFACVLLDEDNRCGVYPVRPLLCRIHGVGCCNLYAEEKPCAGIPSPASHPELFADLTDYASRLADFIFLGYQSEIIVRRPMPLFYYFKLIFDDIGVLDHIRELEFYQDLITLSREKYMAKLVESAKKAER